MFCSSSSKQLDLCDDSLLWLFNPFPAQIFSQLDTTLTRIGYTWTDIMVMKYFIYLLDLCKLKHSKHYLFIISKLYPFCEINEKVLDLLILYSIIVPLPPSSTCKHHLLKRAYHSRRVDGTHDVFLMVFHFPRQN